MGCSRLLTVTPKSHTKIEFLEDSDEKNPAACRFHVVSVACVVPRACINAWTKPLRRHLLSSGGPLSLCGNPLKAGTYAFGLRRPAAAHGGDSKFVLYDQAGETVREWISKRDQDLRGPRPLQVISHTPNSVRLYLDRYWIEMRPYMQSHPMPEALK